MKFVSFLIFSVFCCTSIAAQELSVPERVVIGAREVGPESSLFRSETGNFKMTLPEIDWDSSRKIEVDFVAMMEHQRAEIRDSYIELESPVPGLRKPEETMIELTNEFRRYDRSSNFNIYTGEKKIPAYQEMRSPMFQGSYFTPSRRSGFSVYPYVPYLR